MKLIAIILKLVLKIKPLRKHYFGLYKRFISPKSIFDTIVINTTYDGNLKLKVELCDWIQQQIYFLDYSDINGINFLKKNLRKGAVFLDIGANIGAYTLIGSKLVGENGKVFAFEPVGNIRETLNTNISTNNLKNITVIDQAVYDKNIDLELFISNKKNKGMSSIYRHSQESGEKETVKAIKIDDFVKLNNVPKIDLIKLDIEGAELNAILGMTKTIHRFHPTFIMEISDDILENSSQEKNNIFSLMKTLNYKPYSIDSKGYIVNISRKNKNYHNYVFTPN